MQLQKPSPLEFFSCGVCRTMPIQSKLCFSCKGLKRVVKQDGFYLWWDYELTPSSIFGRHIGKQFQNTANALILVGILALTGFTFWDTYALLQNISGGILSLHFAKTFQTPLVRLLWAILLGMFLSFRIGKSSTKIQMPIAAKDGKKFDDAPPSCEDALRHKKSCFNIALAYSAEGKKVLEESVGLAAKAGAKSVEPLHIFTALLGNTRVASVLSRFGLPTKQLRQDIIKSWGVSHESRQIELPDDFFQIIFQAFLNAYHNKWKRTGPTELLVAVVTSNEKLQQLLFDAGIDLVKLGNAVEWMRIREQLRDRWRSVHEQGSHRSVTGTNRAMTALATPYLDHFSRDITFAAQKGYTELCIGRNKELESVFRVFESGARGVLLLGEAGVGKNSLIEGVAERMIADEVPETLFDKRLIELHVPTLLAGASPAEAEARLIHIFNEVIRSQNIVLYIPHIEQLIGVSLGSNASSMDLSDALAQQMQSGQVTVIATTTPFEHRRFITPSSLGTLFQVVHVKEPETNEAIQILQAKSGTIEYKNNVFLSYGALEAAVTLSHSYIHDRYLPEKALEVIGEAATGARSQKGKNHLVTAEDVARVVSEKSKVPVQSVTVEETDKLLNLETEMHKRVIGQEEAVKVVAAALRRARAELHAKKRPIANFLFIGPTGVGKTELAKTLAEVYFGREDLMIRLDMSEYQNSSDTARLIGTTNESGTGVLTEAVKTSPASLILLDEIEKAHPNILNIFLQVMDDGRLTDSTGHTIDFTNSIIIATSNAGADHIQEQMRTGTPFADIQKDLLHGGLNQYFKPEFINRFDGVVVFKPLEKTEIKQIAALMLKSIAHGLEEKGLGFEFTDAALSELADVGFDPVYGARPLRRAIQEKVENPLSEFILRGGWQRRDIAVLDAGGKLSIKQ
ncbi:MAG: ATP-dependent Clp protease ATP-binding subunit [Candidatus Magasanikbacteria bacterium]|nr:ATP-dependent Clp protease ATP-binding subunit [Candidatus Magasanikbacteria bacterium]